MVEDGSGRSPAAALVFKVAQGMGKAAAVEQFLAKLEENWVESLDDLRGIGKEHLIQDFQFPFALAKRVMDAVTLEEAPKEVASVKESKPEPVKEEPPAASKKSTEKPAKAKAAPSKKPAKATTPKNGGKRPATDDGKNAPDAKRTKPEKKVAPQQPAPSSETTLPVQTLLPGETDFYAHEFHALDEKFKEKSLKTKKNKEKSPMMAPLEDGHVEDFSLNRSRRRTRNRELEEKLQKRREFLDTYSLWLAKEREKLGKTAIRFSGLDEIAFVRKPVLAGPNASHVPPGTVVEDGAVLRVGQVREMSIQQVFESSAFVACQSLFHTQNVILSYLRESSAGELRYMDLCFPPGLGDDFGRNHAASAFPPEMNALPNFQSGGSSGSSATASSFHHFLQDPLELQNRQLQACVLMHARLSEKQLLLWYTGALAAERMVQEEVAVKGDAAGAKDEWFVIAKEPVVVKGVEHRVQVQVNLNPSTSGTSGSSTPAPSLKAPAKDDAAEDETAKAKAEDETAKAKSSMKKIPAAKNVSSKSPAVGTKKTVAAKAATGSTKAASAKAAGGSSSLEKKNGSSKATSSSVKQPKIEVLDEVLETDLNGGSSSKSESSSSSSSPSPSGKSGKKPALPKKTLSKDTTLKKKVVRKPKPKTAKPGRKEYKRKQYNLPEVENSDLRPRSRLWLHLMPRMPDGWQSGLYEYLRPSRTAIRWFRYNDGAKMLTIEQFLEALKSHGQYDRVVDIVNKLHEELWEEHPFELSQNLDENGEILPVFKAPPPENAAGAASSSSANPPASGEKSKEGKGSASKAEGGSPSLSSGAASDLPPTWLPALPNPKEEAENSDDTPVKRQRGRPRKYVTLVPTITNILGSTKSPKLDSAEDPEEVPKASKSSDGKSADDIPEDNEASEKKETEKSSSSQAISSAQVEKVKIPVFEDSSAESGVEAEVGISAAETEVGEEISAEKEAKSAVSLPQKIRRGSRSRDSGEEKAAEKADEAAADA